MFVVCCLTFNLIKFIKLNHACAFRVELPDGRYTFLPEGGDKVADGSVVWTSLGPLPRWVPGPTTR
jgi:hypothetical protein